jgi:ferredoxin
VNCLSFLFHAASVSVIYEGVLLSDQLAIVAFQAPSSQPVQISGFEPILGGELRAKAVWVDQKSCIGCRYCANVATNTFVVIQETGRCRAFRQDGDSEDRIQEAIDTCPTDCIHWLDFEAVSALSVHDYGHSGYS